MKVFQGLLLSACVTFASRAQTNSNFYLKADSGVVFQPNLSYKIQGTHYELPVDPGVRVDFATGYRFTDWCAGELETGVVHAMLNLPGDIHRDYFQVPVLANCILTYPPRRWRPFVGGGAGIVEVLLNAHEDASLPVDNYTTLGCQAIAGITYPVASRLDIGINYKFLYSSQFRTDNPFHLPNAEIGPGMSHTIAAALVYHF